MFCQVTGYGGTPNTEKVGTVTDAQLAEIAELQGRPEDAAAFYAKLLALWEDCDPILHAQRSEVSEALQTIRATPWIWNEATEKHRDQLDELGAGDQTGGLPARGERCDAVAGYVQHQCRSLDLLGHLGGIDE